MKGTGLGEGRGNNEVQAEWGGIHQNYYFGGKQKFIQEGAINTCVNVLLRCSGWLIRS